jgi:hypothetical protein
MHQYSHAPILPNSVGYQDLALVSSYLSIINSDNCHG